jgi:uncharacterized protein (TIGR03437 family)
LDQPQESAGSDIQIASSSASLRLPARVTSRRGQNTLEFQIDAVDSAESVEVSASSGSEVATDTIAIQPDRTKLLHVPGTQFVKYGSAVRFSVSATDPAATIATGELPAGAEFDSTTNEFRWTPVSSQMGAYEITFTTSNSKGDPTTDAVTVQVDSGDPVLTGIVNAASRSAQAACAPGAIASIQGRWISGGKAWANGMAAAVLSGSATELNIICPDVAAGTQLQVVVETQQGLSQAIRTKVQSAAPGIFSVDGSGTGQAMALVENTGRVAMRQNYRVAAQPATGGDRVVIYATGIDRLSNVTVQLGGREIAPAAITAMFDHPGIFQVTVLVPNDLLNNGDVSLSLLGDSCEGVPVRSNIVTLTIDAANAQ